jgi:hypothetical protein
MRVLLVLLLTGAAVLSHQIGYRLAEIHAHKGVSWVDITGINCRAGTTRNTAPLVSGV